MNRILAFLGFGLSAVCAQAQWLSWARPIDLGSHAFVVCQAAQAPDGSTYIDSSTPGGEMYISHFSAAGQILWNRTFGMNVGTLFGAGSSQSSQDDPVNIVADANGVYGAALTERGTPRGLEGEVVRFDGLGNRLWSKFFAPMSFPDGAHPVRIAEDSNGNLYTVVSLTRNVNSNIEQAASLYKLSPTGQLIWTKDIEGIPGIVPGDGFDVSIDHNDNVIVSSFMSQSTFVIKFAPDSTMLWSAIGRTAAEKNNYPPSGLPCAIGSDNSIYLHMAELGTASTSVVERYSSTGSLMYSATLPSGLGGIQGIEVDSQGFAYCVGLVPQSSVSWVCRLSPTGALNWSLGDVGSNWAPLAIDPNGDLVLTDPAKSPTSVAFEKVTPLGQVTVQKTLAQIFPNQAQATVGLLAGSHFVLSNGQPVASVQEDDLDGNLVWGSNLSKSSGDGLLAGAALDGKDNTYMLGADTIDYKAPACLACVSPTGQVLFTRTLDHSLAYFDYFRGFDDGLAATTGLMTLAYNPIRFPGYGVYVYFDDAAVVDYAHTPYFERLDPSGNKLWEFQTPGDVTYAFTTDSSMSLYAAGAYAYKISGGGALLYKTLLPNQSIGQNIAVDSAGASYISAKAKIYKLGSGGSLKWTYTPTFGVTARDSYYDMKFGPDGNLVTIENVYATAFPNGVVRKFSPAGALLWSAQPTIAGAKETPLYKSVIDANNNVYVLGSTLVSNTFYIALCKINSAGQVQWTKTYAWGAQTTGVDLKIDPSGNLLIAGNRYTAASGSDYVIGKVGPDGTLIHVESFNNGWNLADTMIGSNVDSIGDSYLWGWSVGPSGTVDYHVAKYLTSH